MSTPDQAIFEHILRYLQQTRGFDFTAYKRTSLMRRVLKRMHAIGVPTFEAYLDYLQVRQDEFAELFNTILINVTSFFRETDVWGFVASDILPALLKDRTDSIRVWSAGCASGQEPFTVAMLLAEAMGLDGVRERVKIYATDADEDALAEARLGVYTARQVADVPPPLRDRYFEHAAGRYTFSRELRRAVIFGRHDLVRDSPISRVDLLVCRNTLMYFNGDVQGRILARFHFSLKPSGFILLGRAEMLFGHAGMFTPVDLRRRVFRPVAKRGHREEALMLGQSGGDAKGANHVVQARLRDAAFDSDIPPQIVLDSSGALAAANSPARERFALSTRDVGRPLQDLEVSYRPAELRTGVERAAAERREVTIKDVQWPIGAEVRFLDVVVSPLLDGDDVLLGTRINFQDVTAYKSLEAELQQSKQELETAYEELQSINDELETTNEQLQSTIEELETTNEELQSTNEEMETTNEELHATNEELQATNEELQTINEELHHRSRDLNAANAFLESVVASLRSAVVVVDREYRVLVWNDRAADLWGVRSDEAQQLNLLSLDIGLPITELHQPMRDLLNGGNGQHEVVLPAMSRRGKSIECRILMSSLRGADRAIGGVILLMEERTRSVLS